MSVSKQIEQLTRRLTNLETLVQHKSSLTAEEARLYLFANPPTAPTFSGGFFTFVHSGENPMPEGDPQTGYWKHYTVADSALTQGPFNPFALSTDINSGQITLDGVALVNKKNHPNLKWFSTVGEGFGEVPDPRNDDLFLPNQSGTYWIRFVASNLYLNAYEADDYTMVNQHQVKITLAPGGD